jgi:hypothetical protein
METASAPTILILGLLLGILAAAVWVGLAALRRSDAPRRHEGIGKVVVGPTLLDGVWCRLVTYDDGHRRVEVLGPAGWTPSHRDVAHLMQAIPGRSMGDVPKR